MTWLWIALAVVLVGSALLLLLGFAVGGKNADDLADRQWLTHAVTLGRRRAERRRVERRRRSVPVASDRRAGQRRSRRDRRVEPGHRDLPSSAD